MTRFETHAEDIFFSQNDPADPWYSLPYWDNIVFDNGCGMISLTMCIDILTGKSLTPEDVYRMREAAGIDQTHQFEKGTNCICGGDAHFQFNDLNTRLFGIHSDHLDRTVEAFKEALAKPDTVIWASSRSKKAPFYNRSHEPYYRDGGHVFVIWKYENGIFYLKDPHYRKNEGNNVPYTEAELQNLLDAATHQQYLITLV